jgi:hypothetical protein
MGLIQQIMEAAFARKDDGSNSVLNPIPVSELNDDYYDEDATKPPEVPQDLFDAIQAMSAKYNLPIPLLISFAFVESSFRKNAYRYEDAFKKRYVINNPKYQGLNASEINWLATSHGYFQLMGMTAIELGFNFTDPMEIYEAPVNCECAAFYIRKLYNRYQNWDEAIVSYNSGRPFKKPDGSYTNQNYLNRIMKYWDIYKQKTV